MKKPVHETTFLVLALVLGTMIAVLTPPFQSPDEYNHFFKSWQVSTGRLLPEKTPDHRLGGPLPRSLDSLSRAFLYLKNDYSARTSPGALFRMAGMPLRARDTVFTDFANTAIYAPTAYLPQAAAMVLLRPLEPSPLILLYASRLANLLAWALLVFAALRTLAPDDRFGMLYLALLPASLAIAASANADVITNGLCFWLIARAFGQRDAKPPGWLEALALAVVAMNKIVYAPLLLLFAVRSRVPGRQLGALAGITLAAAFGWVLLADNLFIPYDAYHPDFRDSQTLNEGVDPALQRQHILREPAAFIGVVVRSWARALPSIAAHLAGKFGWEKNYLPAGMIVLLWLGLLGSLCVTPYTLRIRHRLQLTTIALLCAFLFSITMYALWCPVGSAELSNLQGRYFVPLLPLAYRIAGNNTLGNYRSAIQWIGLVLLLSGNMLLLLGIWERYYS